MRIVAHASIVAITLALVACGGDDKKVNYPEKGDGGAATTNNDTQVKTDDGAQVGVTDNANMADDAKGLYKDGFQAWVNGDLATAKAKFTEATKKDPKSPTAFYSLGCVLERMGDNAGAQSAYKSAVNAKSDYELAIGAYAISLARSGNVGDATTFLNDKRAKMPTSPAIPNYLAEVRSLAKDSAGAQQAAQDSLRLDSNYKDAMVTIARDFHRNGKDELAKYALTAILVGFGQATPPRDPDNAEAHLLRGLIERNANQRIAAMKDFEAARSKRPDLVEATIQIGAMKLEAGDAAGAQPLLESAVKYAPNQPLAHLNLGDCYRLANRLTDAKKELDLALAQDSTLMAAHYAFGLMYLNAPSFPGLSAADQIGAALRELNQYKTMRGPKPLPGVTDDIDELIAKAQKRKDELSAATAAPPAATPAVDAGKK
jgi:predicted Zn-dependent protease